jgi:hypothetical protein
VSGGEKQEGKLALMVGFAHDTGDDYTGRLRAYRLQIAARRTGITLTPGDRVAPRNDLTPANALPR